MRKNTISLMVFAARVFSLHDSRGVDGRELFIGFLETVGRNLRYLRSQWKTIYIQIFIGGSQTLFSRICLHCIFRYQILITLSFCDMEGFPKVFLFSFLNICRYGFICKPVSNISIWRGYLLASYERGMVELTCLYGEQTPWRF